MSSCISVETARKTKHDFLKQREINATADQSLGRGATALPATRSSDRRLRSKTKQPETPSTDTKRTVLPRKPPSAPPLQPEGEGEQDDEYRDEPFECTSMDTDVLAVKTHMPGKLKMLSGSLLTLGLEETTQPLF